MLLLDNVVAGGTEIRRLEAKDHAFVEWSGIVLMESGWLRHVESDAVTETAEPDATGRQVQCRTDGTAKTAGGWNGIERYCGIESSDGVGAPTEYMRQ
jgi:hypothetical protein